MENTIFTPDGDHNMGKDISETRILIVEDNPEAIIQIKTILENEGYIIDVANGGRKALEYVKETVPDGIILDLMMPEVDGFEVLEKIRSTEKTKNIPVLILTARDLTKNDYKRISFSTITQMTNKGDVDMDGLINKVKQMLGNEPQAVNKEEGIKVQKRDVNPDGHRDPGADGHRDREADLPNVLIVEDNPDNMITIKAIIKDKYNIIEAVDGAEGLKMALLKMPDIILLDMALPKMSGEEILQILKSNSETKSIPIIAVTAQTMKGDKEKLLEAGCDGYIPKPIDPEALVGEMDGLLSG